MKQLRLAVGVTTLCVALNSASAPALADLVDILIDSPNISVMRPPQGANPVEYFFEVSVHNNSPYDLNFDGYFDLDLFMNVRGITVPFLYQGPGPLQVLLGGGPLPLALKACGDGISLTCLHPQETFVGNIAYGFVESDTQTGLYAVTQDGLGHPATMSFQGTYMLNGETISFTQESPAFAVNVVAQNAVPEAHPWVLLLAGLASVLLIGSRRIRG